MANLIDRLAAELGAGPHRDFTHFMSVAAADAGAHGLKLTAKRKTLLKTSLASKDESAAAVIKAVNGKGTSDSDELRGLYRVIIGGKPASSRIRA